MMSTRRRRVRPAAAVTTAAPAGPVEPLADIGREQVAMAMDASCAMFRGFEAMRAIQQQAAQQAAARHADAARKLRESATGAEWLAVPVELWQADLQSAGRYWQDLAGTVLETQTEMLECAWHLFDAEGALQGVSAVEALERVPVLGALVPAALALCQPPRA